MASEEPFTARTVAATTAVSLVVFGLVYVSGAGVPAGSRLGASWLLASVVNVLLFLAAGVVFQVRAWRGVGA